MKFADADLLGIPVRLTVGAKGVARGVAERRIRATGAEDELPLDDVVAELTGAAAVAGAWQVRVTLPVPPPVAPMLAKLARELPTGGGWSYEPKWDGFRCIVFRDGDELVLGSRNERPLNRYFPEILDPLRAALPDRAVVDGELVIATDHGLDFDLLSLRIHPAASRVAMLAEETPSSFVAFDVLADGDEDLRERPFGERRARCSRRSSPTPRRSTSHPRRRTRASRRAGSTRSRAPASMASSPRRSTRRTGRGSARW